MNEEEKKAIEILKDNIGILEGKLTVKYTNYNTVKAYNTILNFINKLQKENEGLKEYIAIAPNLDEMTAIKYRNIQQDAYIQGRAEEQQKAEQIIYENYIPIKKVKDKIEEIQEEGYWLFTTDRDSDKCVEVLQELLESEK